MNGVGNELAHITKATSNEDDSHDYDREKLFKEVVLVVLTRDWQQNETL